MVLDSFQSPDSVILFITISMKIQSADSPLQLKKSPRRSLKAALSLPGREQLGFDVRSIKN